MAVPGGGNSSGYSDDSPGYGHLFRNQSIYASGTETVFWDSVLDRLFDQHHHRGTMASFRKTYSRARGFSPEIRVNRLLEQRTRLQPRVRTYGKMNSAKAALSLSNGGGLNLAQDAVP